MSETSSRNSKSQRKTFPKEGEKKLKDTIQKLKARNRYLEKKIKFYENKVVENEGLFIEGETIQPHLKADEIANKKEDFRKEFLRKFRESIKGKNEDI